MGGVDWWINYDFTRGIRPVRRSESVLRGRSLPFRLDGNLRRISGVMRVGGNGLPNRASKGQLAKTPSGHFVDRWLTYEEKDHHHHQERAQHEAQHPRRGQVMGQEARA